MYSKNEKSTNKIAKQKQKRIDKIVNKMKVTTTLDKMRKIQKEEQYKKIENLEEQISKRNIKNRRKNKKSKARREKIFKVTTRIKSTKTLNITIVAMLLLIVILGIKLIPPLVLATGETKQANTLTKVGETDKVVWYETTEKDGSHQRVPVPKGFSPSYIDGEMTVNGGFVVYDVEGDKIADDGYTVVYDGSAMFTKIDENGNRYIDWDEVLCKNEESEANTQSDETNVEDVQALQTDITLEGQDKTLTKSINSNETTNKVQTNTNTVTNITEENKTNSINNVINNNTIQTNNTNNVNNTNTSSKTNVTLNNVQANTTQIQLNEIKKSNAPLAENTQNSNASSVTKNINGINTNVNNTSATNNNKTSNTNVTTNTVNNATDKNTIQTNTTTNNNNTQKNETTENNTIAQDKAQALAPQAEASPIADDDAEEETATGDGEPAPQADEEGCTQQDINIFNLQKTHNQFVWVPVDDVTRLYGIDENRKNVGKII